MNLTYNGERKMNDRGRTAPERLGNCSSDAVPDGALDNLLQALSTSHVHVFVTPYIPVGRLWVVLVQNLRN